MLAISLLRKESISATVNRDGTFISVIETSFHQSVFPAELNRDFNKVSLDESLAR